MKRSIRAAAKACRKDAPAAKNACQCSDPLPSLFCRRSRRARKGSAAAMPPKKVVEEETGCARFGCALPASARFACVAELLHAGACAIT